MSHRRAADVLVIGAGPAGSATAIHLARRGFHVLLVDRARFPRPKPCAEYLSPGTVALLERLGVLARLQEEDPPRITGMRIVEHSGRSFVGRFANGTPGMAFSRQRLDAHLVDLARESGVEVAERTTLTDLEASAQHGRMALLRHDGKPLELKARVAVGADGLNSRVARQLGLTRRRGPRRVALVAHVTGVAGLTDVGEMHVTETGYVGLAALGNGVATVAAVVDLAHGARPVSGPAYFWTVLQGFPRLRGRLDDARLASPVRAVGPFARTTRRATADHALLVGDAADFFDPFTGEGIYAALRGSELAAEQVERAFARARFAASDLAGYDRDRRRVFGGKWLVERGIDWVIARPLVLRHVARRFIRSPSLADRLVSVTAHVVPPSAVLQPTYLWRLVV